MKRIFITVILTMMVTLQIPFVVSAQITDEQIVDYLSPIGWDSAQLEMYLQDNFGMSISEFETLEDLKEFAGTPITAENRQELLDQYGMSYEEIVALLADFGETPEDYFFVEDLEAAIHFYTTFDEDIEMVDNFFSMLGITDEELDKLFLHLAKLDEVMVEEKMAVIEQQIASFGDFSDATELTEAQKEEITSLFTDMLSAFNMSAKFYLEQNGQRSPVAISTLMDMETLNNNVLIIEFFDNEGELIFDMSIDENLFDDVFLNELGDTLHVLPDLAHEHPLGEKMPETASPYSLNVFIGLGLMFITITLYVRLRRKDLKDAS